MFRNLTKVNNGFIKGFESIYYAKVHCPLCKEEIFANALICPFCKTNFTQPPYNKDKNWQKLTTKVLLLCCGVIGLSLYLIGTPIVLAIIVGFVLYGGGFNLIQKIQSIKNYHRKK